MGYVIFSVLAGLCSWGVPFVKMNDRMKEYRMIFSFVLCILSIYFQILLMKSYGDQWTPIVDAVGALASAVPVLVIGTVLSNLLSCKRMKPSIDK